MKRREFLQLAAVGATLPLLGQSLLTTEMRGDIPYRPLGLTGERVSIIGIGGFHIGIPLDEQLSIRIIRTAIDSGVNFMDNSWDYHQGLSEMRMGHALAEGYREKVFLMTKIDGRDKRTAMRQLDESLRRLNTDRVDLLQFHEVIRLTDVDAIFNPDEGALNAMFEARRQGKVRYIGFTGHKDPAIHRKMLEVAADNKFTFDAVQMPLNVMDAHFNSFEKQVLPMLLQKSIGVLGMKPMGDKIILESKKVTATECLHYAMNLPTSVVITGCESMPILDQALSAARTFKPMTKEQLSTLLAKTAEVARDGKYERYKTSHDFDATYRHPEWLGCVGCGWKIAF
ncbi:MAG: aldo/keto reductase [Terriglobales bacterium]